ncbi:MAG: Maltose/maltodextrin transporter, permease protein MalG [Capsulimonas sp.]|nr:Maltose/maltodextrin transporter, permease protein MalG [Capsulimonas sp.]
MALIPVVGRRSRKIKLLYAALYLVLSLGAVTMIYPLLVMLGASVTSQYDNQSYQIVPAYLSSDKALLGKYVEDKFSANVATINTTYGANIASLQDVKPPKAADVRTAADWNAFFAGVPSQYKLAGFAAGTASYSPSALLDRYQAFLSRKFHGDITALDKAYTQEDNTFLAIFPPFEQPGKHAWLPDSSLKSRDWAEFEKTLPLNFFIGIGGNSLYNHWLKEDAYPGKIDDLNKAWGTTYKDFGEIALAPLPEGNPARRKDWEKFVRTKLPIRFLVVDSAMALPAYCKFIQVRYKGDLADYNKQHASALISFEQVPLPNVSELPSQGAPLLDWTDFLKFAAPLTALRADTLETRYQSYLAAHGAPSASADIGAAIFASDWEYVKSHPSELRMDYLTRNYKLVINYILLHGNAVWNTILFCALSVITALIVNPLCAYALSRFNLSYGNSILLFLLTTMAFPAEVTLIPNFLLLKDLNLLNTFWALVLPAAASGYAIFLMKGFFDSLPRELYEAGTLDGATEMRMFASITLPLSRPIFAVIALDAFRAAYSAFMFALLVCQSPKMWTMMVWIYELGSSGAPQYVTMAALTLAAIPTLLIFIFAQNTIMKGIIVPSYK